MSKSRPAVYIPTPTQAQQDALRAVLTLHLTKPEQPPKDAARAVMRRLEAA